MRLNDLYPSKDATKLTKRRGRGAGSGHGKTACRGHKGQKARSGGGKPRVGFEGGQMPLARRLPKRGFTNLFKVKYQIVNIKQLNKFKKDSTVTPEILEEQGLIKNAQVAVKILGDGKISKPLNIQACAISKPAKSKIEQAGGKVELSKEETETNKSREK